MDTVMRKFILAIHALMLCVCAEQAMAENAQEAARIQQLMSRIAGHQANPAGQFGDTAIDGAFNEIAEFGELAKRLAAPGADLSALWGTVGRDREKQIIFLHALRDVSGPQYLKTGEAVLGSMAQQGVDPDVFVLGYLMPNNRKRWFFSSNHSDPRIRGFIGKVKTRFADRADVVSWADDVLSGKLGRRDEVLRSENPSIKSEGVDRMEDRPGESMLEQAPSSSSQAHGQPEKSPGAAGPQPGTVPAPRPWLALILAAGLLIALGWRVLRGRK